MPGGSMYASTGGGPPPATVAPVSGSDIHSVVTSNAAYTDIPADTRFVSVTTDGSGLQQMLNIELPSNPQYYVGRTCTVFIHNQANGADDLRVIQNNNFRVGVQPDTALQTGRSFTSDYSNGSYYYGGVKVTNTNDIGVFQFSGSAWEFRPDLSKVTNKSNYASFPTSITKCKVGSPPVNYGYGYISGDTYIYTGDANATAVTAGRTGAVRISTGHAKGNGYYAGTVFVKTGYGYNHSGDLITGGSVQLNSANGIGGGGGVYITSGTYVTGHQGGIVQLQSSNAYIEMYSDSTGPKRGMRIGVTAGYDLRLFNIPNAALASHGVYVDAVTRNLKLKA